MPGDTLGRYRLIRKLATGGMAEIWLATAEGPEGFKKKLVVKKILPNLAEDDEFVRMFLDEARIAARLNHPNVAQIFDLGEAEGCFFLAMEYVPGKDLRRVYQDSARAGDRLPVPLTARVLIESAKALDYAHHAADEHGRPLQIVHRDVSPQNILVTFQGGVKLVDFGIAKAADQASQTRTGVLKGKYSYMSPEQAAGLAIDGRTDIFALGIVGYELVTGFRLFKRDTEVLTLQAVRDCKIALPSSVNASIPRDLDAILMRALARKVEDRYATAGALALDLEEFLRAGQLPASGTHLAEFMRKLYGAAPEEDPGRAAGGSPGTGSASPGTSERRLPVHEPSAAELRTGPGSWSRSTDLAEPPRGPAAPAARPPAMAARPSRPPTRVAAAPVVPAPRVAPASRKPVRPVERTGTVTEAGWQTASLQVRPVVAPPIEETLAGASEDRTRQGKLVSGASPRSGAPSAADGPEERAGQGRQGSEAATRVGKPAATARVKVTGRARAILRAGAALYRAAIGRVLPAPSWERKLAAVAALALSIALVAVFLPQQKDRTRLGDSDRAPATPAAADAGCLLCDLLSGPQGTLTVVSEPPATVYAENRELGATPLIEAPVDVGPHVLRLVNDAVALDTTVPVEIDEGKLAEVRETFPLGSAVIPALPGHSFRVLFRDKPLGHVPGPPIEMVEGSHVVTLVDDATGARREETVVVLSRPAAPGPRTRRRSTR